MQMENPVDMQENGNEGKNQNEDLKQIQMLKLGFSLQN